MCIRKKTALTSKSCTCMYMMANKLRLKSEGGEFDSDQTCLLEEDNEQSEIDRHGNLSVNTFHQDVPAQLIEAGGPNVTCSDGGRSDQDADDDPEGGCQGFADSEKHQGFVVYAERWYILSIFSMLAFMWACVWNTWGPIEDTAIAVLGWNPGTIALLANWGPITFIISAFFFSWLLHAQGLRTAILVTGGFLVFGLGVRCIPVPVHMMIWTMNVGHIFIGLAGPICMAAVTSISATWFPTNERTTATALTSTLPAFGVGASFLIGPLIVGEVTSSHETTTFSTLTTSGGNLTSGYRPMSDHEDFDQHLQGIKLLMIIEFVLTALLYLAAVIYFPATPVTPPAASAVAKREDMKAGMLAIIKKASFWIPALSYGLMTGAYDGWSTQIVVIFHDKIDQTTVGWLGFYTNVAVSFGGVIAARCADYLGGKMKIILLILITASCASITWTILLVNDYIPYSEACIFTSVILFGLFLNSTIPLFFEITVEGAFPIGEETTTMLLTLMNNLYALVFLILPMIHSVDSDLSWLNWVMLGSAAICIPLMLFYKEHYNRLEFDVTHRDDGESTSIQQTTQPA